MKPILTLKRWEKLILLQTRRRYPEIKIGPKDLLTIDPKAYDEYIVLKLNEDEFRMTPWVLNYIITNQRRLYNMGANLVDKFC